MSISRTFVVILGAMALSSPVFSAVIFDNADPPLTTTSRSAGNPPLGAAAYLQIGASNVNISQIAINAAPGQNGLLKFVIFSDVAPPGNNAGSLLLSDTVSVNSSGTLSYILSDPLAFTLQAGHFYDIGALFNGTTINYSFDLVSNTQNGITSIVANQNVDNFASPVLNGHAGADINIRLFAGPATVPEPGSLVLGGFGLAALGIFRFATRRRRLPQVPKY